MSIINSGSFKLPSVTCVDCLAIIHNVPISLVHCTTCNKTIGISPIVFISPNLINHGAVFCGCLTVNGYVCTKQELRKAAGLMIPVTNPLPILIKCPFCYADTVAPKVIPLDSSIKLACGCQISNKKNLQKLQDRVNGKD